MLKRLRNNIRLAVRGEGDVFIAHVAHNLLPSSVKKNEWGGYNYKFKAVKGQEVMAMRDDNGKYSAVWDEITFVSVHTKIPEYIVEVDGYYSITCSPRNSILIRDMGRYRRACLMDESVIGMQTPIMTKSGISNGRITSVVSTGKKITMYDLSLRDNMVFLADGYLFVYDTMGIHVPVSQQAIEEAERMMPSKNMYNDVADKIRGFPDHSAALGLYILSKAPEGRKAINDILPPRYKITDRMTKPQLSRILSDIAKEDSTAASVIVDNLMRLGDNSAYETGFSFGLSDLAPLSDLRKDIMAQINRDINSSKDKSPDRLRSIYKKYSDIASGAIDDYFRQSDTNPVGDIVMSKARGSASQMRDLLFSPISVNAADQLPKPIKHSYMEGLTPSEYFAGAAGARAGTIGKSHGTAQPGALGKILFTNTNMLVINKDKGTSMGSIRLSVEDDPNELLDRYLSEDIYAGRKLLFEKDTVVTPRTIQIARKHNIKDLPVYSPLGSSSADGGIPSMSYGIIKGNKLPEVGYNIGAHASAGIVSPLYTESMQSFHTGASLQDRDAGYPRLKQVLELTKSLGNKATLASVSGTVSDIKKDSLGGHIITIEGEEHYAGPNNKVSVHRGSYIEKGDPISDGPIDPRDIARLKDLPAAQKYMVDELVKNTPGYLKRRAAEVIVEGITRYAEVVDPGESEYLPGDIKLISEIEKRNKELDDKIQYEHVFRGVNTMPMYTQQWMSQLNFRNLKKTLSNAISTGAESDIHSYEPAPALAWGTEFGKGENGKY